MSTRHDTTHDSSEEPVRLDRRAARREETKAEILDAAWDLVREQGLAGLAMRDLGARVGMKAQSLYSYYESKLDIYDAMFHQGYRAFVARIDETATDARTGDPVERARAMAHLFFEFCTSDPVRYQLLFQRTIPDFEPSEESFAVALAAYETTVDELREIGITDPEAIDLWTAMLTGLTDQQISNDPGGDRWKRLIDRAVDAVLRDIAPHLIPTPQGHDS